MGRTSGSTDRVESLLATMTVEEKASLTAGDDVWHLPAVERLGIGRLKMSDGPSGVRGERIGTRKSLSFPCGMAAGATWDVDLMDTYGRTLAAEARAKRVHVLLGPTVCIPRTPLAGRTFESLSEDPHLSARLTVSYVRGVQDEGVACCVKHFAANDQEHERMTISAEVDERTLREVHLPSFEAAVTEAGAWSVMSAYNRLNGTYCSEHPWLLGEVLKGEWGFDGVVVSDWFGTHSTDEAALAGLDVEMPGPGHRLGPRLADAVNGGRVPEEVLDDHARRILRLAERTGLLDRTAEENAAGDPPQDPEDATRRAVSRAVAVAGTVLLRNDGVLPIKTGADAHTTDDGPAGVRTVAVIGPNSDLIETGGGGSSQVMPHRPTSLVAELRDRLGPHVSVVHERGCSIDRGLPDLDMRLVPDGFHVDYMAVPDLDAEATEQDRLWTGRLVALGDPAPGIPVRSCAVRVTGTLVPNASGRWQLGIANVGSARLLLDGEVIVDNTDPAPGRFFYGMGSDTVAVPVDLEAGKGYELTIELVNTEAPVTGFSVSAQRPPVDGELARAVSAAEAAEVAVVVVGSNSQWETEGDDRPNLDLVGEQDDLVRAVAAANPNTVVVVNCGAPVLMPWADDVAAVLVLWYPGEEGAAALADILTGIVDPGGRLPITFPRRVEDVATHSWYPGGDGKVVYGERGFVGYRHFDVEDIDPQWSFGHGLSYTRFEIGAPSVAVGEAGASVTLEVTNVGDRSGAEVVQVYVGRPDPAVERPVRELRGFAKLALDPGSSTRVTIPLDPRSFSYWDVGARGWSVDTGTWTVEVGRSSRDLPRSTTVTVS